jgi:hypothetical protein
LRVNIFDTSSAAGWWYGYEYGGGSTEYRKRDGSYTQFAITTPIVSGGSTLIDPDAFRIKFTVA